MPKKNRTHARKLIHFLGLAQITAVMVLAQLLLAPGCRDATAFFSEMKPGFSYATARIQTRASLHRPWLSLGRRRMPRCGACGDAPVLRSPGDRRERHTRKTHLGPAWVGSTSASQPRRPHQKRATRLVADPRSALGWTSARPHAAQSLTASSRTVMV